MGEGLLDGRDILSVLQEAAEKSLGIYSQKYDQCKGEFGRIELVATTTFWKTTGAAKTCGFLVYIEYYRTLEMNGNPIFSLILHLQRLMEM